MSDRITSFGQDDGSARLGLLSRSSMSRATSFELRDSNPIVQRMLERRNVRLYGSHRQSMEGNAAFYDRHRGDTRIREALKPQVGRMLHAKVAEYTIQGQTHWTVSGANLSSTGLGQRHARYDREYPKAGGRGQYNFQVSGVGGEVGREVQAFFRDLEAGRQVRSGKHLVVSSPGQERRGSLAQRVLGLVNNPRDHNPLYITSPTLTDRSLIQAIVAKAKRGDHVFVAFGGTMGAIDRDTQGSTFNELQALAKEQGLPIHLAWGIVPDHTSRIAQGDTFTIGSNRFSRSSFSGGMDPETRSTEATLIMQEKRVADAVAQSIRTNFEWNQKDIEAMKLLSQMQSPAKVGGEMRLGFDGYGFLMPAIMHYRNTGRAGDNVRILIDTEKVYDNAFRVNYEYVHANYPDKMRMRDEASAKIYSHIYSETVFATNRSVITPNDVPEAIRRLDNAILSETMYETHAAVYANGMRMLNLRPIAEVLNAAIGSKFTGSLPEDFIARVTAQYGNRGIIGSTIVGFGAWLDDLAWKNTLDKQMAGYQLRYDQQSIHRKESWTNLARGAVDTALGIGLMGAAMGLMNVIAKIGGLGFDAMDAAFHRLHVETQGTGVASVGRAAYQMNRIIQNTAIAGIGVLESISSAVYGEIQGIIHGQGQADQFREAMSWAHLQRTNVVHHDTDYTAEGLAKALSRSWTDEHGVSHTRPMSEGTYKIMTHTGGDGQVRFRLIALDQVNPHGTPLGMAPTGGVGGASRTVMHHDRTNLLHGLQPGDFVPATVSGRAELQGSFFSLLYRRIPIFGAYYEAVSHFPWAENAKELGLRGAQTVDGARVLGLQVAKKVHGGLLHLAFQAASLFTNNRITSRVLSMGGAALARSAFSTQAERYDERIRSLQSRRETRATAIAAARGNVRSGAETQFNRGTGMRAMRWIVGGLMAGAAIDYISGQVGRMHVKETGLRSQLDALHALQSAGGAQGGHNVTPEDFLQESHFTYGQFLPMRAVGYMGAAVRALNNLVGRDGNYLTTVPYTRQHDVSLPILNLHADGARLMNALGGEGGGLSRVYNVVAAIGNSGMDMVTATMNNVMVAMKLAHDGEIVRNLTERELAGMTMAENARSADALGYSSDPKISEAVHELARYAREYAGQNDSSGVQLRTVTGLRLGSLMGAAAGGYFMTSGNKTNLLLTVMLPMPMSGGIGIKLPFYFQTDRGRNIMQNVQDGRTNASGAESSIASYLMGSSLGRYMFDSSNPVSYLNPLNYGIEYGSDAEVLMRGQVYGIGVMASMAMHGPLGAVAVGAGLAAVSGVGTYYGGKLGASDTLFASRLSRAIEKGGLADAIAPVNGQPAFDPLQVTYDPVTGKPVATIHYAGGQTEVISGSRRLGIFAGMADYVRTGNVASLSAARGTTLFGAMANTFEHFGQRGGGVAGGAMKALAFGARSGHYLTSKMVPFANPVFAAGWLGLQAVSGTIRVGGTAVSYAKGWYRGATGSATQHEPMARWSFHHSAAGKTHRAALLALHGVHKGTLLAAGLVLGKVIYEASQTNRMGEMHLMAQRRFDRLEHWSQGKGLAVEWVGGMLANLGRNITDLRGNELRSATEQRREMLSGFDSLRAREGAVTRGATSDTMASITGRALEIYGKAIYASFMGLTRASQLPEIASAAGTNMNIQMNQTSADTIDVTKIVNRWNYGPFTGHTVASAQIDSAAEGANDPHIKMMLARQVGTDDVRFANEMKSGRVRAAISGVMFDKGSGVSKLTGALRMAVNIRAGNHRDFMGMTASEILSYYGFNKGGGMLKSPKIYKMMQVSALMLSEDGHILRGGHGGMGVDADAMQLRDSEYVKNLVATYGVEKAREKMAELMSQAGGRYQSVREQLGVHFEDGTGYVMRSSFSGEVEDDTSMFSAGPGQTIDDPMKAYRTNSLVSSLFNYPGSGGGFGFDQMKQLSALMALGLVPLGLAAGAFAVSFLGTVMSDPYSRLGRRVHRQMSTIGSTKLLYLSDAPRASGQLKAPTGTPIEEAIDVMGIKMTHTHVHGVMEPQGTVAAIALRDPVSGEYVYFGGRQGLALGEERGVGKGMGVSGSTEKAKTFLEQHDSMVHLYQELAQAGGTRSAQRSAITAILDQLDDEVSVIRAGMQQRGGYATLPTATQEFVDGLSAIRSRLNRGATFGERALSLISFGLLGRNGVLDAARDLEHLMASHALGANFGRLMGLEQIRGAETLRLLDGQVEAAGHKQASRQASTWAADLRQREAALLAKPNLTVLEQAELASVRLQLRTAETMAAASDARAHANRAGGGLFTGLRYIANWLGTEKSNSARGSNVGSARGGRQHIMGSAYGSSANMGHAAVGTSVSRFQTMKHFIGDTGGWKSLGALSLGLLSGVQTVFDANRLLYGPAAIGAGELYGLDAREQETVLRSSAAAGIEMGVGAVIGLTGIAVGMAAAAYIGGTVGAAVGLGFTAATMYGYFAYGEEIDYPTQMAKQEQKEKLSGVGRATVSVGDFLKGHLRGSVATRMRQFFGKEALNLYVREADHYAISLYSMFSKWTQQAQADDKRSNPYAEQAGWWTRVLQGAQQVIPNMFSPVLQTKAAAIAGGDNMSWSTANPFWASRSPVYWMNSTYKSPYGAGLKEWFYGYYRPQIERMRKGLDFGAISSEFVNDETLRGVVTGNPDMMQQQQSLYTRFQQKPRSGSFASALNEAAAFRFDQVGLPGAIIHREIKRRGIITEMGFLGALFRREDGISPGLGGHVMRGAWGSRGSYPRMDGRQAEMSGGWAIARPQDFDRAMELVMPGQVDAVVRARYKDDAQAAAISKNIAALMPSIQRSIAYVRSHHYNVRGLDAQFIAAIMAQESGGEWLVSPKGATGYMQVMPETFGDIQREMRLPNMRYDNQQDNILAGVYYIAQQLKNFGGNQTLALSAYNAGPGATARAGGVANNPETRGYVNAIMNGWMNRIVTSPGINTQEAKQEQALRVGLQTLMNETGTIPDLEKAVVSIGGSIGMSPERAQGYVANLRQHMSAQRLMLTGDMLNNTLVSQLVGGPVQTPYDESKPGDKGVYRRDMAQAALNALGYVRPTPQLNVQQLVRALVSWSGARVTSWVGHRHSPGGVGSTNHAGLDIAAPLGDTVRMPGYAGTVLYAGHGGGYGNLVTVGIEGGYSFRFGHLSRIDVMQGAKVNAGTLLGLVGSTGYSTGPHLHFEVRSPGGAVMDPVVFFGARQVLSQHKARYSDKQIAAAERDMASALERYDGDPLLAATEAFGMDGYRAMGPIALEMTRLAATMRQKLNGVELDEHGLLHAGHSAGISSEEAMQRAVKAASENYRRVATDMAIQGLTAVEQARRAPGIATPWWAGMLGASVMAGVMPDSLVGIGAGLRQSSAQLAPGAPPLGASRVPGYAGMLGVSAVTLVATGQFGIAPMRDLFNEDVNKMVNSQMSTGATVGGIGYSAMMLNEAYWERRTRPTPTPPGGAAPAAPTLGRGASAMRTVLTRISGLMTRVGGTMVAAAAPLYHGMGMGFTLGARTPEERARHQEHRAGLAQGLGALGGGLMGAGLGSVLAGYAVGALALTGAAATAMTVGLPLVAAAAIGGLGAWALNSAYGSRAMQRASLIRSGASNATIAQTMGGASRGPMARPQNYQGEMRAAADELRRARTPAARRSVFDRVASRAEANPGRYGVLLYVDAAAKRLAVMHQLAREAARQDAVERRAAAQRSAAPVKPEGTPTRVAVPTRPPAAPRNNTHAAAPAKPVVTVANNQATVRQAPRTTQGPRSAQGPQGGNRNTVSGQPLRAR